MKIIFDHQIFYYQYGGASKYFSKLLEYLPHDSWRCTAIYPYSEYLRKSGSMKTHKKLFRGDSVAMEFLNRPYTYHRLDKGDYDVYHQTNFSVNCLKHVKDKPVVVTYHDSNLSTFDPHPEIVERQRQSVERADAIVCVSENTKQDLLRLFKVNPSKVHVVYHGIEDFDLTLIQKERIIEDKYILYVGRRSEYKNFPCLAKAFSMLHRQFPGLKLVCTMNPFNAEELDLFKTLGIQNSVTFISATELDMKRLYRDAEVFVFPSRYEGFGMPILEAWQSHCPVILSNASCFPEIAADAAMFFEPDDSEELADQIQKMITDKTLRNKYVDLGCKRIKKFSWEKCAMQHYDIYKNLI